MGKPDSAPTPMPPSDGQAPPGPVFRLINGATADADAWSAYCHPALIMAAAALFAVLFVISRYNYLLFHSFAELFAVAVAWGVFLLVFSVRRFVANDALVLLATAYLFVGLIDLFHTMAYKGMGIFHGVDGANLATQLWIAARYMESLSLLAFAVCWTRSVRLPLVLVCYPATTMLVFLMVFHWSAFPDCFIEGIGLTPFKIASEYLICFILTLTLVLLARERASMPAQVFIPMVAAILFTIVGEVAFTVYVSVYGLPNLIGHFAKILSCMLVYQALIRTGLTQPHQVLFNTWKKAQEDFRQLVEAVPISIMRFDASGIVTYVNPFHLQTFGAGKHSADFFIGRKIHELPGIVGAGVSQEVAKALEGVPVMFTDVYFPRFTGGHAGFQSIKAVPLVKDGMVSGGFLVREDVSQLRRHEQRFSRALATIADGFWLVDRDGRILETNRAAAAMLGYPPGGLNGLRIQDVEAVEDKSHVRRHLEKIMRRGHDRFASRHRSRDGRVIDVEVSASFLSDEEGCFVVFTRDISDEKRAEDRLIISEAKFAAAFHNSPMLMSISNLDDGTVIDVNDAFARATGFSKSECIGRTSTEIGFIGGEARKHLISLLRQHRRLEGHELELFRKDGTRMVCEYWGEIISLDNRLRLISIAHDITARKSAQQERDASEKLLRLINRQNDLKQLIQETAGILRQWSGCQAVAIRIPADDGRSYTVNLGFAGDTEVVTDCGKPPAVDGEGLPHPRTTAFLACMGAMVVNGTGNPELGSFTDGGSFWTNSITDLRLPAGETAGPSRAPTATHPYESVAMIPLRFGNAIMGLLQYCDSRAGLFSIDMLDMFERLAAKLAIAVKERREVEALQNSEQRYRSLFENAPVGIFNTTSQGRVIAVNPEMARILGAKNPDVLLNHYSDLGRQLYASPERRTEFLSALATHGQVKGFEYEAVCTTGKRVWLRMDARVGESQPDGGYTIEGFSIDITPRKRMERLLEARLRLSEFADTHNVPALLQRTLDEAEAMTQSGIGFFHIIEADQQVINRQIWSSATQQTACRADGFERHYPVEKAGVWADCLRARRPVVHNDYQALPHRQGLPDGHPPMVRDMLIPVFREDRVVAVLGLGNKPVDYTQDDIDMVSELANMAWDIVVRRNAENDLMDSRRALQTLVGNLPGIAFRCRNDAHWTMMYIGGSCRELTGYDPEDFIGNRTLAFVDIVHAEDRGRVDEKIQAAVATIDHYEIEYRIVHASGTVRWVWERGQAVADLVSGQRLLEGFITDVTGRKQNEQKLQMQAMVLDQIHDRVLVTDLGGAIAYANRAQLRVLGFSGHELVGRTVDVLGDDPEHGASQAQILERALADGSWKGEVVKIVRDGSRQVLDCRIQAVRDAQGKTIALCGISTDITERRRWENELRRLASAIDQAAESIMITDPDGTIVFVNPSFERITGYRREEVEGRNPRLLKSGEHDRVFYQEMWQTLAAGQTFGGSFANRRKDGSRYIEKGTISPVFNANGEIINYVAVRNDVTDEIKLEEQLSQAQKMEAIGTLAGGIAHDFNNMLFPMVGYAEMLKEDLPAGSLQLEYVDGILSAALRARDLVQQILAFSRQSKQERYPIRVQHIVKEAVKLTRASLPSSIRIDMDVDAACPPVLADPTQIHQILMNLITNAYHAMEEIGGVLSLSLETIALDSQHSGPPILPGGAYVCLKVADTGHGIAPEIRERIFEPYFTTKAEGKGTGLGLSVIHGIVTSYQGDIQVESEPGRGAVFTVFLPALQAAAEKEAQHETSVVQGGSERILLVDDEAPIIGMVQKMLQRLGYAVTTRTSSLEALEAFRANPDRFDLVITDMTMPAMTGDQLTMEIKRIRPDLPVILCTGFSNRIDAARAAEIGIQGFVLKPILRQDIAGTIRKVLDN